MSSESLVIPLGFSQKILVIDTLPVGLREELAGVINQGLFAKVGLAAFRKVFPNEFESAVRTRRVASRIAPQRIQQILDGTFFIPCMDLIGEPTR